MWILWKTRPQPPAPGAENVGGYSLVALTRDELKSFAQYFRI